MINNGFGYRTQPILQALKNVECRDAVLNLSNPEHPRKAVWPDAEFIVGNPPFIGSKLMRGSLSDTYVDALFKAWDGEVPREADFVCYWHEGARQQIEAGRCARAGLLATQGIRGGANQKVLKRIQETGQIFDAWQDEDWVVEGAAVRISIVCQDSGNEQLRRVDGAIVQSVHADLSPGTGTSADLTTAVPLAENSGISFMGDTKGGAFDIPGELARSFILAAGNPHGRSNADVVLPWANGIDVTRRPRDMFIIDFGVDTPELEAAMYEKPFAYVAEHVRSVRAANKRDSYASKWWIHVEPRPALRAKFLGLTRYLATVRVSRHRSFSWMPPTVLPDSSLIVFARTDDYFFGVLSSRAHEVWALSKGTQLEDRPRYTPSSTFETFPFPWPLNTPDGALSGQQGELHTRITNAARSLNEARSLWLNPPDLVNKVPDVHPNLPPRLVPLDSAAAGHLARRTLTQLYNHPPEWLLQLRADLDRSVFEAYGWPADITDEQVLARLLELNHQRARTSASQQELHP